MMNASVGLIFIVTGIALLSIPHNSKSLPSLNFIWKSLLYVIRDDSGHNLNLFDLFRDP